MEQWNRSESRRDRRRQPELNEVKSRGWIFACIFHSLLHRTSMLGSIDSNKIDI